MASHTRLSAAKPVQSFASVYRRPPNDFYKVLLYLLAYKLYAFDACIGKPQGANQSNTWLSQF